ncbi:PREDICTED: GTP-binding protein 8-like [Thamnophis sirtalis]|uniref:GTP-binding protein 8-like n=1 Tax=Thamnophis sirtalis TaxID=35019 RepID=A0A6I9XXI6_9SAUR|nr:PREDICTED: GTP-binding protein 8-like [Thamnophis sirtalis]XP_013918892.1 PREDICTED: GTP-binding protein 8-like [Thamnophis sirtalis]
MENLCVKVHQLSKSSSYISLLQKRLMAQRRTPVQYASFTEVQQLPEKQFTAITFPLQDLAKFLSPNVDRSSFCIFKPNQKDIQTAERFFIPSRQHIIDYSTSAVRMDHAPEMPEPEESADGPGLISKGLSIQVLTSGKRER